MGRFNTVQRCEALARTGTSHREVALGFNFHHSRIDRLADRYHETNCVQDLPRSGRHTVRNPRQDQRVTLTHARNRFLIDSSTVGRIQHTHQITVSTSTIRRRLRAAGMTSRRLYRGPILTHRRRKLRLYARHVRWSTDM